jgi:hypothetical protein
MTAALLVAALLQCPASPEFYRGAAYAELRLADGARAASLTFHQSPLDVSEFDAGVAAVLRAAEVAR